MNCNDRYRSRIAALAGLLGVWTAALAPAGPALAQAGGGAPTAYLFCYTGSGAITSPTSFAPCSGSNPLAVSGGGGGGAATIANGADVAEGSTTDAPATTPTTVAPATTIALLKALNNGVTISNFPATQPVSGTVTVIGPTPDGSAASTNPVLISGTTDGTATGLVAVPKVTAGGVLSVDGSASTQPVSAASLPLPAGAATSAAQTTMATNQTAVQAPVAPGAATATKSELVGGQYNSAVQAFTNGQQGALQFDQRGGLLIQDGQVIPSVSVTSATTLFTVADTSGYGSISVQVTSAGTTCTITYEASEDGTTWAGVAGYASSNTGASAPSTTTTTIGLTAYPLPAKQFRARVSTYGSGTVTVQGTLKKDRLPTLPASVGATLSVGGTLGDGANTANGFIGVGFEGRTTNKGAVTNGTYVRPITTSIGVTVNKPFQVPELDWSYPAAAGGISNTTTAVTMVAAAGAGIRNYLTAIQVSAGALGAASEIAVRDGAGGTVIWRGFLSTAGGNQSVNLSSPIKSTANTLLEVVTLTATITGAVYVNAQGYQAP